MFFTAGELDSWAVPQSSPDSLRHRPVATTPKPQKQSPKPSAFLLDAKHFFDVAELAFGEIAYLLGFASAQAFQRAFRRWNNQTPGEFRRSQRHSA